MTKTEFSCREGMGSVVLMHRRLGWAHKALRPSVRSSTQAGQGCRRGRSWAALEACGPAKQEPSLVGGVVVGA